ncbi:hypothetical protein [Asticcacaulis taihuensis]|uniref:Splicing factor, proline-and glutamine-rich n=1 Tax=Asticcacaulis taihuensis TaxID=260084 RepID=A0A1G4S3C7_9CAUL|nr:hypothetical protein [Asticcacaulis taihuensis]SCW63467.1 splicing factor, proline-and glutamine-rich [Asticcacaulis taihuensis]
MKYARSYIPAAVLIGGLLALSAAAQDAAVVPTPTGPTQEKLAPPAPGTPEHAAQIQREHERAVAAGDHANDPLNPASSNALNQQEAAKAAALGNGPVPANGVTGLPPVPDSALPTPDPATPGVPSSTMPATGDPAMMPTPADTSPPPAGDPLKPDPATVK